LAQEARSLRYKSGLFPAPTTALNPSIRSGEPVPHVGLDHLIPGHKSRPRRGAARRNLRRFGLQQLSQHDHAAVARTQMLLAVISDRSLAHLSLPIAGRILVFLVSDLA